MNPIIASLCIAVTVIFSMTSHAEDTQHNRALELFAKFEKNEFIEDESTIIRMGWIMWAGDKMLSRTLLERQSLEVSTIGIKAFPTARKYLDHAEPYMRFIAARSLQRITGEYPDWYWFGTPGERCNGDTEWADQAKQTWDDWYAAELKQKD